MPDLRVTPCSQAPAPKELNCPSLALHEQRGEVGDKERLECEHHARSRNRRHKKSREFASCLKMGGGPQFLRFCYLAVGQH